MTIQQPRGIDTDTDFRLPLVSPGIAILVSEVNPHSCNHCSLHYTSNTHSSVLSVVGLDIITVISAVVGLIVDRHVN